ncbi:MAG: hypothetical protein K0R38_5300 [Polyangiaceae bacterium]|jgi:hypothetical protein|nr:hypothetical protein [Polyangiaceae bacterium]
MIDAASTLLASTSPDSEAPRSQDVTRRPRSSEPPAADYVDLDGGSGRDVFYRPDRYLRSDLGLVRVNVEVRLGGERRFCELFDVSQNGIAFEWSGEHAPELGAELEKLTIQFDEHEAYAGLAKVGSVRHVGATTVVGVSLLDSLMNIEDVLHLRDVKAWVAGSKGDKLRAREAPWFVHGLHEIKASVSELRLFLEDGQVQLAELEASLPSHILQGAQTSPARDALIARMRDGFSAEIVRYSNQIDAATRAATPSEWDAARVLPAPAPPAPHAIPVDEPRASQAARLSRRLRADERLVR